MKPITLVEKKIVLWAENTLNYFSKGLSYLLNIVTLIFWINAGNCRYIRSAMTLLKGTDSRSLTYVLTIDVGFHNKING